MTRNWIKKAISRPGAFKAKAKRAGMSTKAYASKVLSPRSKADTRTKQQATLAKTLATFRKRRRKRNGAA